MRFQVQPWVFISLFAITLPLYGNPIGGRGGDNIDIHDDGEGHLIIDQKGDKGVINWDKFDIHKGESVQFNNNGGITLNRVFDSKASQIDGSISSSGKIFIINPHGVVFGASANVNVASLVATVADIKDSDFLNNKDGKFHFDIPSGDPNAKIVNHGHISTIAEQGLIALVAPGVINDGVIEAKLGKGKIALGAGDRWTLDMHGDELIRFDLGEATEAPLYHIDNSGRISANAGSILLTAQAVNDAVHSVINMDGIVEAKSVANVNGKIVLGGAKEINVAGLVDASGLNKGERGGEINITGDKVTIGNTKNKTTLTASGDQGGGTVLVGGDYQGAGKLANAQTTTVNNTTISADATRQGDGGKVVVWSDDTTEFHGDILARGAHGGDGGLVETSGKHFLTVTGASVNASGGLGGHNGSWLLDPGTYTVDGTNVAQYTDALKNNTDVTIATTADPANNDLGDLFINADMFWDKNSSLTLSSAHDLGINAKISNSAGGNLTLRADNAATNSGTVVFGSAGGISLSTGNVDIFYNAMNKNGQTGFNNMQQIDYKGLGYVTMGSGEYNAYMLVNTIDDLAYIANHLSGTTNNVSHYSFALGANLNEGGNNFDFKSIGNLNNPFMGTFNGNGYTINNLNFVNDAGQPIGLFGVADGATLENIQLSGINISAPTIDNVGAVVGQMQHHSTLNNAIVTNSSISGKNNTGGAVGAMIDSTASQIFVGNNTSITGGDTSIPGADTAMNAGGVVGSLTNSTLELSAADATVTGGTNVGGLVGIISDALSSVSNSFSIGAVSGVDKVGGFVGSNSGTITSAYSTGAVTASGANPTAGGFAGDQQGLVTNGYWNTETSNQTEGTGNAANSGIVGLTTANMTNAGTDNEMLAAFNIGNANSPWGVKSANPNDATIDPSTPYLTWCGSMCTFLVDLGPNNPGGGGGNTGGGNSGNGGNGGDGTGGSGDPSNTANPPPVDIRNEIVKDTQQGLYGSTQSKLLENPPEDPMECSQLYPDDQQKIYECELEKPKYAPGSYPPASNVKPRH